MAKASYPNMSNTLLIALIIFIIFPSRWKAHIEKVSSPTIPIIIVSIAMLRAIFLFQACISTIGLTSASCSS